MNQNMMILSEEQLVQIDGGGYWLAAAKGVAILGSAGAGGVLVGAAVVVGTYYGLQWMFG